jgi:hypothetical protein
MGVIDKHPEHKREIIDLLNLCVTEIEDGGSREHECELCRNEIEELIKN